MIILSILSIVFLCVFSRIIFTYIILCLLIETISILFCLVLCCSGYLIIILIICSFIFLICYIVLFIPTQLIESGLIIIFYICLGGSILYLICTSFPVFFIPLCCTNPFITYLVSRYCHFWGFKWSKIFNDLFSIPAYIADVFLTMFEFILK